MKGRFNQDSGRRERHAGLVLAGGGPLVGLLGLYMLVRVPIVCALGTVLLIVGLSLLACAVVPAGSTGSFCSEKEPVLSPEPAREATTRLHGRHPSSLACPVCGHQSTLGRVLEPLATYHLPLLSKGADHPLTRRTKRTRHCGDPPSRHRSRLACGSSHPGRDKRRTASQLPTRVPDSCLCVQLFPQATRVPRLPRPPRSLGVVRPLSVLRADSETT